LLAVSGADGVVRGGSLGLGVGVVGVVSVVVGVGVVRVVGWFTVVRTGALGVDLVPPLPPEDFSVVVGVTVGDGVRSVLVPVSLVPVDVGQKSTAARIAAMASTAPMPIISPVCRRLPGSA
jgi:hypothetical protein